MTIAAGFQCNEGFVLCADRQMSHGSSDEYGSFAHYEKKVFASQGFMLGAALCGCGNEGDLIRPFADIFFGKLKAETQLAQIAGIVEETLNEFNKKRGKIPEVSFLIAAVKDEEQIFLKSDELIVHPAGPEPEIMGIGESSVVRYLIDSVFKPDLNIKYVAALAVLIVYVAKKYCPQYCGGQTDVYVLPKNYFWETLPISEERVNAAEAMLAVSAQAHLPKVLYEAAILLSSTT